ncbi:MAG: chromosomal replication initiator protein DnaA [Planctomycetota bacterium]
MPASTDSEVDVEAQRLQELWNQVQQALQASIKPQQFETWFRRAAIARADDEEVSLAVHNGFTRDWLEKYYRGEIEQAIGAALGPRRVIIEVDPEITIAPTAPSAAVDGAASAEPQGDTRPSPPMPARPDAAEVNLGAGGLLHSSDIVLNASYRFDNFVVGPCNRFAHAACVGVAESPGQIYNPLFIHGSVGLGKTHLLQSLCHAILDRDRSSRILYLSCETFVNHFISALENGDLSRFRGKYRNVDLLVVDDIHLLANKERTQEEFFHTFNALYNAGKQIVLSSDSPPVEIPTLQERLVSRFKWGLVTESESPCYETRMAILLRKSRERGRQLPEDVARLLAERIDSNIRELEGAVTKLIGFASLSGRPIDVELVRHCLRDLFASQRREPTMEDIIRVVTERFGVKLSELQSKRRSNAIAFPRQIGMVLARRMTRMSLEEVGSYFGGRDHSTVLHAVRKIERLVEEDPRTRELVADLTLDLQGPGPA